MLKVITLNVRYRGCYTIFSAVLCIKIFQIKLGKIESMNSGLSFSHSMSEFLSNVDKASTGCTENCWVISIKSKRGAIHIVSCPQRGLHQQRPSAESCICFSKISASLHWKKKNLHIARTHTWNTVSLALIMCNTWRCSAFYSSLIKFLSFSYAGFNSL